MRLTSRHAKLLREATHHAISDHGGEYYRLGGHGVVPITYNRASYPRLERMGLVTREAGYWKATQAGKEAIGLGSPPKNEDGYV